jgi:cobalamin biosynthetic protein CobC
MFEHGGLEHGGRLRAAARRFGRPEGEWLDLSTGINPVPWPVPALTESAWARLPEDDDGLEAAALAYYRAPACLPVAGSQAALQALPSLRQPGRVGVLTPGYAEHARAWARAGHQVLPLAAPALAVVAAGADAAVGGLFAPSPQRGGGWGEGENQSTVPDGADGLPDPLAVWPEIEGAEGHPPLDVVVLIHPNNPTGTRFAPAALLALHRRLAARGGWLVVDEAFLDPTPGASLAAHTGAPGLIVLRSLGKFFGLAGARVGFVLAEPGLLAALAERLGPWAVAGPSRRVARLALSDRPWQEATRARLVADSARLATLLAGHGLAPAGGTALFQWVPLEDAAALHEALARAGIWTRLFAAPASLRLGLPATAAGWQRLDGALSIT